MPTWLWYSQNFKRKRGTEPQILGWRRGRTDLHVGELDSIREAGESEEMGLVGLTCYKKQQQGLVKWRILISCKILMSFIHLFHQQGLLSDYYIPSTVLEAEDSVVKRKIQFLLTWKLCLSREKDSKLITI